MQGLINDKEACCGCGACEILCPKNAITMEEDKYGFIYPKVDGMKCCDCGLCKKNCAYLENRNMQKPRFAYAAINTNSKQRKKSASGGVFSAIATKWIEKGGYICGAVLDFDGRGIPWIHHIISDSEDDIKRISGSKYVQSDIKDIIVECKQLLKQGKNILFTGTPCQVSQVKKIFSKYQAQLLCIDLICHGVPSQKMFRDAVSYWNKLHHGRIYEFDFRDKSIEWGLYARISYKNRKNIAKSYILRIYSLAYYYFFIESVTYRESCYHCPYACEERTGDLTMGDFWRIEKKYGEFADQKDVMHKGVSCLLVNTDIGEKKLESLNKYLEMIEVDFSYVKQENGQLRNPSKCNLDKEKIMNIYLEKGYDGLVKELKKQLGLKFYYEQIKAMLPYEVKDKLKRLLGREK